MPRESTNLADAIATAVHQQGATAPEIRGADWQLGVVTTVDVTPGTVDCGTIRARRMETYQSPQIGDRIALTRSGTGNWLAWGRTNPGTDTPWTQVILASGFSHNGNGQGNIRYRIITVAGTPYAQWHGGLGITYPSTGLFLATALPGAARPAALRTLPVACSAQSSVQNTLKVDFATTGTAQVSGFTTGGTNNPPWVSLNGVQYTVD